MWRILLQISPIKTLRFNLRYFSIKDAIKLPVLISRSMVLKSLHGKVRICSCIKPGLIKIGFESVGLFDRRVVKGLWESSHEGEVIFCGSSYLGSGSRISICGGKLIIGNNFTITANSSIICRHQIRFGNNCLVSWDSIFMDTDFHKIYSAGKLINVDKSITVGDDVWFGCRTMILKGSSIAHGSIIAAGSIITAPLLIKHAMYGGVPAKLLKEKVFWQK